MDDCIFCNAKENKVFKEIIFENEHAFLVPDNFPATQGHLLVISKQHFANWFVTPLAVQQSILNLKQQAYAWLVKRFQPDGFNIGTNCGAAAGQSIFHIHYHIIPRYIGDHPNPSGGIRRAVV